MPEAHAKNTDTPRQPDSLLDWRDIVVAVVLGLLTFAIYVATLAPGLLKADSGEFQTLAVTLGYAHPTGYPVYLLLAKAATWIPVGDVPYRVNLLSSLAGSLSVVLMYLLCRVLIDRRWVPIAAALALAVSPTFWSQAIIAEVYTSGIAAMLGVLLCMALWQRSGRVGWLFLAGCLGGTVLGIHSTHVLLAPAVLVMLVIRRRRWKASWSAATLGALTGFAITLAAFWIIDRADSPTSYFRTVIEPSRSQWDLTPEDTDGFFDRVRLSMRPPQYTGLLLSQSAEQTREEAAWYFDNLRREFPLLWLALAVGGVWWLWRRNWQFALLLLLSYLTHLLYDLAYDMGGIHVLYLATYVPIAVFGAAGLAWLTDGFGKVFGKLRGRKLSLSNNDGLLAAVGTCVVIWPMLFPSAWNEECRRECGVPPEEDPFRVEYSPEFHEEVRELIDELEPDAVVFTGWCLVYPYYYVAQVERGRTDLTFIQDYPDIYHFELADSAIDYVNRTAAARPVYFTHDPHKNGRSIFRTKPVKRGQETLHRVIPEESP